MISNQTGVDAVRTLGETTTVLEVFPSGEAIHGSAAAMVIHSICFLEALWPERDIFSSRHQTERLIPRRDRRNGAVTGLKGYYKWFQEWAESAARS